MNTKSVHTRDVLDEYEKRFAKARYDKRCRSPWEPADRADILRQVREVLAIDRIPTPNILPISETTELWRGINVRHCTYRSWEHFYGTFSLFEPRGAEGERHPVVFLCVGHGADGRLTPCYLEMCFRLCMSGMYVICNDAIGRGSRRKFGHEACLAPFFCGITLQGMIVAETQALIRYAKTLPFTDPDRLCAIGNSGGGVLTACLAALEPSLAVVASCGYPGEFHYIFQKERAHCACNLLPHVMGKLDMWELYSLRAPKPLLLEQGQYDDLFPVEYFLRNARKLSLVYEMMGARESLTYTTTESRHSWEHCDIELIAAYLEKELSPVGGTRDICADSTERLQPPAPDYPSDAIATDTLAEQLTGLHMPWGTRLEDIFVPRYKGKRIRHDDICADLGRGSLMRTLAQFEASL